MTWAVWYWQGMRCLMDDKPKDRKPLTPAQIERNRRAGLIRSKQRSREEYQEMIRKRWEKKESKE